MGDGKSISFWCDVWLMETALCDIVEAEVDIFDRDFRITKLWTPETGWNLHLLHTPLPDDVKI